MPWWVQLMLAAAGLAIGISLLRSWWRDQRR
jgi:hypothetical protein